MIQKRYGLLFDTDVVSTLRREYACLVLTSKKLDVHYKVDGDIRQIGRRVLAPPVQFQVTLRADHFIKLNEYLRTRRMDPNTVSLYAEVKGDRSAQDVARHVAWAANELQGTPHFRARVPIYGLRITDDAAFFDPFERLEELKSLRASRFRSQRRLEGLVERRGDGGFWITSDDGRYFADFIEVQETDFRRRLMNGASRMPVRFFAAGPGRAEDVRPT